MAPIVVSSGGVLVFSAPVRPVEHVSGVCGDVEHEGGDEVSDLGQAQFDDITIAVSSPLFDRVTVRKAWASMESVMCLYHPVYCRTW